MSLTILQKDGQFAAIGLRDELLPPLPDPVGVVGVFDSRREVAMSHRVFNTHDAALDAYIEAAGTSLDRGWGVAYSGEQLNFPAFS